MSIPEKTLHLATNKLARAAGSSKPPPGTVVPFKKESNHLYL